MLDGVSVWLADNCIACRLLHAIWIFHAFALYIINYIKLHMCIYYTNNNDTQYSGIVAKKSYSNKKMQI